MLIALAALFALLSAKAVFATKIIITVESEKILAQFDQTWAFDEITLPAVATRLWGKGKRCSAATVQIANRHFVSSVKPADGAHLSFALAGIASDSVIITPLLVEVNAETADAEITFIAVPAAVRLVENELEQRIDEALEFHRQNQCFSCHTALPLAFSCKAAAASGLKVNNDKVLQLGDSISQMQQVNGTFYFPQHPDYGIITTTLGAGAVLAMLSNFSDAYLSNLLKILDQLPGWLDKDGFTRSDFYLRPLFIGQITSALFETIIVSTIYCRMADTQRHQSHEQLRQRLIRMSRWTKSLVKEPIHRKIILMAGMPYLFQISEADKSKITTQLQALLAVEPEGKKADVRALAKFVLNRIAPSAESGPAWEGPFHNRGDKIWHLFEKIINLSAIKAKKEQQPADRKP